MAIPVGKSNSSNRKKGARYSRPFLSTPPTIPATPALLANHVSVVKLMAGQKLILKATVISMVLHRCTFWKKFSPITKAKSQ
ncbi:MAG: hypothetical protein B0W54_23875 [Cellvibrio sp. 79]|nr:MAG: hypothetical protein B0W54_23875 [Cellvibrio sp. 79]